MSLDESEPVLKHKYGILEIVLASGHSHALAYVTVRSGFQFQHTVTDAYETLAKLKDDADLLQVIPSSVPKAKKQRQKPQKPALAISAQPHRKRSLKPPTRVPTAQALAKEAIEPTMPLTSSQKRRKRRQVFKRHNVDPDEFKESVRKLVYPHFDLLDQPFLDSSDLSVLNHIANKSVPAGAKVNPDTAKIIVSNYKSFFPELYAADGTRECVKYRKVVA